MTTYNDTLTVPPNTPESNPVSIIFKTTEGILDKATLLFDKNSALLVGARIKDRSAQIAPDPESDDAWFRGDGNPPVVSEADRQLDGPPHEIVVEAYSEDDTYTRSIEITLEVVETTLKREVRRMNRILDRRGAVPNVQEADRVDEGP